MAKRMLIDATHHEETRVVVMDGNKLVEFDYESQFRRQLKGNVFLAKVTRVEPSLQAAFVNFGGNRHGFLPFSEIHPDYYRIPVADREALLAEQQAMEEAARAAEEAEDAEQDAYGSSQGQENKFDEEGADGAFVEGRLTSREDQGGMAADLLADEAGYVHEELPMDPLSADVREQVEQDDTDAFEGDDLPELSEGDQGNDEAFDEEQPESAEEGEGGEASSDEGSPRGEQREGRSGGRRGWRRGGRNGGGNGGRRGGRYMGARARRDEISDEGPIGLHARFRRKYKIQEVIKRGQIMLIQVSKEERGNKGAAVTTYLSLPGRYCVLMPNSPRGGGVSRKIDNFADRRRLKDMLRALEIPSGMSVILRTAGVERTETEIKRDYDYLLRLWNNIRELTLESTAPALIYEEGDLIKRSIRDIYTDDIEDITVSGENGFKEARDFMGLLMPTHVDQVTEYKNDKIPLFQRYQVEGQINCIGEPVVQLKSGGYLVINQTEALVAVDVNSGRATRERHIEETALKTNLEAAEEVARQLRLRDLGGLVVIDFIDMEDRRNNVKVERRLKDALANDRARIQVGRISSFGLLELSRQRLNPSLTEAQFQKCPHCEGFGYIRSVDSAAIMALRSLEEEGVRARTSRVTLHIPNNIALYILNSKREMLAAIEQRYRFKVLINVDETLAPSGFRVEAIREERVEGDEDEESDSESETPTSSSNQNRRGGRNKKPVLMEQALEYIDQEEVSDDDASNIGNEKEEESDQNFNRPEVEPNGDGASENGSSSRGPRRNRGRGGRDRDNRDNRENREGRDNRGERDNRRGGRNNNNRGDRRPRRADPAGQDGGQGNENGSAPMTGNDQGESFEKAPSSSARSYDQPVASAPKETRPQPTYFVAKRRTVAQDTAVGQVASGNETAVDPDPTTPDGSKKKGWWSKFS